VKDIAMPSFRLVSLVVLVLALAACGKESDTPAEPAADGATATAAAGDSAPASPSTVADATADTGSPPPDLGKFRIVSVLLGTTVDGYSIVIDDSRAFTDKDPIYASVLSSGPHQGLRLSAKWLAPDGSVIAETSQPVVPVAGTATTFSIKNPQPWPPGDYEVVIAINGHAQRSEKFQVR